MSRAVDLSHWEEEIPASALESDWYENFAEWFAAFVAWSGLKKGKIAERLGMQAPNLSQAAKRARCTPGFAAKFAAAFEEEGVKVPARFVEETRGRTAGEGGEGKAA